jgi:hypothetical protein
LDGRGRAHIPHIPAYLGVPYEELTSPDTWTRISDWANANHIARLAFWSVNRDRSCPGGGVVSNCIGINQNNWQFTSITAGFKG